MFSSFNFITQILLFIKVILCDDFKRLHKVEYAY